MNEIITQLDPRMIMVVCMVLMADIIFGAVLAAKEHRFRLQEVGNGLVEKTVPFGVVILFGKAFQIGAEGSSYADWVTAAYNAAWAFIVMSLAGSILENVQAILGKQLPIPSLRSATDIKLPLAADDTIWEPMTDDRFHPVTSGYASTADPGYPPSPPSTYANTFPPPAPPHGPGPSAHEPTIGG